MFALKTGMNDNPSVRREGASMHNSTTSVEASPDQSLRGPLPKTLCAFLVVAGFVSLPAVGSFGPLPTTAALDTWFILFMAACFLKGKTHPHLFLAGVVAYLLTRIVPALLIEAPIEDFLQAYRWTIYLMAFALAVGKSWGPVRGIVATLWVLLTLAAVKALATFAIIGPGARPGLLLENNFELALYSGLLAVLFPFMGRSRYWAVGTLGLLTVLAGSRSGAVVFLILVAYVATQTRELNLFYRYLISVAVIGVSFIPLTIFTQRANASQNRIDRERFLDVFVAETRRWDPFQWILGTTPITPLQPGSCAALSFYENLFSSAGDGSCYSVILHAFLLRIVFDAGLLGLALATVGPIYLMKRAGVTTALNISLTAVSLANGLSVSGINNPYVAFPILLAILTAKSVADPSAKSRVPGQIKRTRSLGRFRHNP